MNAKSVWLVNYGLDNRWEMAGLSAGKKRTLLLPKLFVLGLGPRWLLCTSGTRDFSLGLKRRKPDTEHSPPSSIEINNERNYTATWAHAFFKCKRSILPLQYAFICTYEGESNENLKYYHLIVIFKVFIWLSHVYMLIISVNMSQHSTIYVTCCIGRLYKYITG